MNQEPSKRQVTPLNSNQLTAVYTAVQVDFHRHPHSTFIFLKEKVLGSLMNPSVRRGLVLDWTDQ